MRKLIMVLSVAVLSACATLPAEQQTPPEFVDPQSVRVMVIGAFHMGNPGQDVVNSQIDDMLTDQRQAEIAAVAQALAAFKPTVVAVERVTNEPDYIDQKYLEFTPDKLKEVADERYQIGYRLASLVGIARVFGVDEQPDEGEPDYFPFDKLMAQAEAIGQSDKLNQQIGEVQAMMARFDAMQKDHTVAELLIEHNGGGEFDGADFYYRMFEFDRGETQPGAELQAYWFMRNAKIFSKLMQVTKPGDRVVVVYGSGHEYWLDHFAEHTPGFVLVDPLAYLQQAAIASR